MVYLGTTMKDQDKYKDNPKPKPLRSVSDKEQVSVKNKSKQQLKNYCESGFDEDEYEDNFSNKPR